MEHSGKQPNWLLDIMQDLLRDEISLHFSDFAEVADSFVEGYAKFSELGLPDQTIALAMLGATINIYEMFGKRAELPALFRALADKIEENNLEH